QGNLRWMAATGAMGTVSVAFERGLLLTLLERRYGGRGVAATPRDPGTERVTATEERLIVVLTQQMVDLLYARIAVSMAMEVSSKLQVKLDGRVVSKEITLGALFDLKVGDVIPVDMGRADVLLDEARLFTAAVAEHKGKLCLTSFEDAE